MREGFRSKSRRVAEKGLAFALFVAVLYWTTPFWAKPFETSVREAKGAVTESEALMNASLQKLGAIKSLSADVEFESRFFGERYFGRGRYEEQATRGSFGASRRAPFESVKFSLQVALATSNLEDAREADREDNFLRVVCDCDALAWWSYSSINGSKTLRRINLDELWNRFQMLDSEEREALAERGVGDLNRGASALPGLGGLLGTLSRIAASYEFEPEVEAIETEDGARALKISGVAKEGFRKTLGFSDSDPTYEDYLATAVEVLFDADSFFPRRVAFFSSKGKKGRREPVFAVSYFPNDEPVRPEDFNFEQPQSAFEPYEVKYVDGLCGFGE
ncbi:MAG: hypothetical protein IJM30_12360 [Thermoguttaceae bacterium]|nr:hypothetical protein [Thermoguttaceae bacterium]